MASRRIEERRARAQALQGGRRAHREAVLPVRDVPRHGDEPRRRRRDHRARRASGTSPPTAPRMRAGSGRTTPRRPTRARRTSCPRPDWYFYFLFYLLRIFKWPDTVVLGTVGIPNILLGIAIALPFIDLRRERRLTRRPVAIVTAIIVVLAMGTLTYKGATAKEALASETIVLVPEWAEAQGFADNPEAVEGAELFAVSGCLQCHTYLGTGGGQPRRARPDGDRRDRQGRGLLPALRREPGRVRQHGHAAVRRPRRGEPARRSRRSSTPPRARRTRS